MNPYTHPLSNFYGVDEDYGDGPPSPPIYINPIPLHPSTPPPPQGPRVARFPHAFSHANQDSESDDDMFSGLSLQQLSRYGSDVGPNSLADALAQSGLRSVIEEQHPNVPIRPMALNAIARPSRVRPRIQNPEAQWRSLTARQQNVIRRMLRQIPCHVSHESELGMMRLLDRFRNSRRRNGGGKKSYKKKTHKRKC